MKKIVQGLTLSLVLIFNSCGSETSQNNGGSKIAGATHIAVDEAFKPLLEAEIAIYQASYPKVKMVPHYVPGEKAIEMLLNSDTIDLAITTRLLTKAEEAQIEAKKRKARNATIAKDAIAFITHPQNPDSLLTLVQMKDILTGKINNWKQINSKSNVGELQLVFDDANSSTAKFIQDSVLAGANISAKAFSAKSSEAVFEYVKKTPNAIGLIGVNWISDHDDDKSIGFLHSVRVMRLQTPDNCTYFEKGQFYQPYTAVINQNCYPMKRLLHTINKEAFFGPSSGFVAFLSHDQGQRIILKAGLVPYYSLKREVRLPEKAPQ